ncbi:MAG: PhoH family protein [Bifidobacteriaceae bacterium]|nr:PhoH family protein [Bifidobacteriaceae bacterium]
MSRTGGPAVTLRVADPAMMFQLLGREDQTLRAIEALVPAVDVYVRGDEIRLAGPDDEVARAQELLTELIAVVRGGAPVTPADARRVHTMLLDQHAKAHDGGPHLGVPAHLEGTRPAEVLTQSILSSRGRTVRPKTLGQKRYVDAIDQHTITFGIGPAGTGKTYLAMAKAVQALQSKAVRRIVLTRPAVEAGERLGFLPGTLSEKIDPYLRPLYDALQDMIEPGSIPKLMEAGTIEVAPLAYMRGRTLNDAFIILDEAQNTSAEQMKMFLTRLGFGAKMVVTGDITQVDLPGGTRSGLRQVRDILVGIDDLVFCELTSKDVVRHRLVSEIIDAYGRYEEARRETGFGPRGGRGAGPSRRGGAVRDRWEPGQGRGVMGERNERDDQAMRPEREAA